MQPKILLAGPPTDNMEKWTRRKVGCDDLQVCLRSGQMRAMRDYPAKIIDRSIRLCRFHATRRARSSYARATALVPRPPPPPPPALAIRIYPASMTDGSISCHAMCARAHCRSTTPRQQEGGRLDIEVHANNRRSQKGSPPTPPPHAARSAPPPHPRRTPAARSAPPPHPRRTVSTTLRTPAAPPPHGPHPRRTPAARSASPPHPSRTPAARSAPRPRPIRAQSAPPGVCVAWGGGGAG